MTLLSPTPLGTTITGVGAFAKTLVAVFVLLAGCERPEVEVAAVPPLNAFQTECFDLIQGGDTGPARIRLRQRIDSGNADSRLLFLMGLAHHWDRNYTRAIEWLRQAEAAVPTYPPASHFLGWSLYHAGLPEESTLAFHRHLGLDATEGDSYFALGVLALERGEIELASAYLDRAIFLQKDKPARAAGHAKSLAKKAEIAEMQDSVDSAIELLKQAVGLNPDLYEAHYRLARLLQRRGFGDVSAEAQQAGDAAKARVEAEDPRPR